MTTIVEDLQNIHDDLLLSVKDNDKNLFQNRLAFFQTYIDALADGYILLSESEFNKTRERRFKKVRESIENKGEYKQGTKPIV